MKIERIKAVRELGELDFMFISLTSKVRAAEQKCAELGFSDIFDVYDFIREFRKDGVMGLLECKQFVERTFPAVTVEDCYGNSEGTFDNVEAAVKSMLNSDRQVKFSFYQNGARVAVLDLS